MRGHFFALFFDLIFLQTQKHFDVDAGFLIVAFSDLITPTICARMLWIARPPIASGIQKSFTLC
jgi:hypothetical protein